MGICEIITKNTLSKKLLFFMRSIDITCDHFLDLLAKINIFIILYLTVFFL